MLKSRLFDKYVVAVNIGAILAMCATPFAWSQSYIYQILVIIAGAALLCSALCFAIGWPFYTRIPPYDSAIVNCFSVYKNAFDSWRDHHRNVRLRKQNLTPNNHNLTEDDEILEINERKKTFLDYARLINHGKFNDRIVDDIKSLRKALIVFTLLIPYWLVYHQVIKNINMIIMIMRTLYRSILRFVCKVNLILMLILVQVISIISVFYP